MTTLSKMKVLKVISFVALAAALHAGVSTAILVTVPSLYPTPEMTARVQQLVFQEAGIAFAVMACCWFVARQLHSVR